MWPALSHHTPSYSTARNAPGNISYFVGSRVREHYMAVRFRSVTLFCLGKFERVRELVEKRGPVKTDKKTKQTLGMCWKEEGDW